MGPPRAAGSPQHVHADGRQGARPLQGDGARAPASSDHPRENREQSSWPGTRQCRGWSRANGDDDAGAGGREVARDRPTGAGRVRRGARAASPPATGADSLRTVAPRPSRPTAEADRGRPAESVIAVGGSGRRIEPRIRTRDTSRGAISLNSNATVRDRRVSAHPIQLNSSAGCPAPTSRPWVSSFGHPLYRQPPNPSRTITCDEALTRIAAYIDIPDGCSRSESSAPARRPTT